MIGQAAQVGALATAAVLLLAGCGVEKRAIGPQPPMTPPTSADDRRTAAMEDANFQVSEGSRLFRWHGCDQCHTEDAPGAANLTRFDRRHGGTTVQLYRSIAEGRGGGMPAYAGRITSQQIWQLAAYVHRLPGTPPAKRLRASSAQLSEGQGDSWSGPLP